MKRNLLSLSIAALLATAMQPAAAQPEAQEQATAAASAQPSEDETGDTALDTVIVTGTRRADRTVGESLSPIDVITPTELENTGTPDLQSVLTRLVPSFNFPRTSITDASDHVRPAQLRGLAPDQTLVLINGKRMHRTAIINVNGTVGRGSSPADLNTIPIGAIERIEVLRDGASAQYGSDAIAGVINIVLKSDASGGNVDASYGHYDAGDGELNDLWANTGFSLGDGGFVNLTAEWKDKGFTSRSEPDLRQQYPLVNGAPDPREQAIDRVNHRFGDADTTDRQLFINSVLPLSDDGSEFYAFGNLSDRDGESAGFFRRAVDARNVLRVHPDGFLPLINSDVRDRSLIAGFRGFFGDGWSWDVSANTGDSRFDFTITDSLNNSLPDSNQTEFFAGTLDAGQAALNFDIRNAFDVGFMNSPLSSAFGVEYRRETFEILPGELTSYTGTGSQVFPGFRPSDSGKHNRHNTALYADFEGDVTERLSMGAALRYEDYSDFGSQTSGKLAARYAFSEDYALRATVSTGFRAPNLQQQFYSTTATNFINGVPFDIRTFPVDNPVARALGAEDLKAEESTSYSLGFVAQPLDGLSATLDVYRIDIDDRIILSENLTGAAVRNFLAARGFPGTDGGRYFTNAIDTKTDGVDLVVRYDFDLTSLGTLGATFAYNYNDTDITRIAPNPAELTQGGLNLQRIGRVEIGRIQAGPPRDKVVLGMDWQLGDFSAQLTGTRYGEWAVLAANPLQDEFFDPQWVADLSLSYRWGQTTWTLGSENLFDQYPRKLREDIRFDANGFASAGPLDNSFVGILPYARGEAPFGFNGRFLYAKFRYQWD
jgi:iron complex outermembrane receptor protein